jgi:hypothetical protein
VTAARALSKEREKCTKGKRETRREGEQRRMREKKE